MNENGGLGTVVLKNKVVIDDTLWGGKLNAVRHANGKDWRILSNKLQTNSFYKILAHSNGVDISGYQSIGIPVVNGLGQAVFSPDGTKFVVFTTEDFVNKGQEIHIYDFDRCSGELTIPI